MYKNTTHLRIITPKGIFLDKNIDIITVQTTEGRMGILHGKSPIVASLEISELDIISSTDSKKPIICAIAGGIIYATSNNVEIITDAIEFKDKIDLTRAAHDKKVAEDKLKQKLDDAEILKAKLALRKAINRITIRSS